MKTEFDIRARRDSRRVLTGRLAKIRFMARADGWVMVRRPGCTPFVLSEQTWMDLPLFEGDA